MDFVKMVETFIPTLKYCSLTINFARKEGKYGNDGIHIFFHDGGYCLFDISTDIEHFFSSSDGLFNKTKEFLSINDVSDVEINGINRFCK